METYDFFNKPQFIYNVDETGIQPEYRPPNVIAPLHEKAQAVTSPRSTTTTIIRCVNTVGNSIPPFFVLKDKRQNPDLMKLEQIIQFQSPDGPMLKHLEKSSSFTSCRMYGGDSMTTNPYY
ncbi:hypothetical protein DPMN_117297 [Dreissena polymorpha]|uniref:Uncharacterized protein n=1 Tax=Dreissena polymorpha TaxID=45954 RepID=A0A9D4QU62_DREPO|nr:hypothetical protein DPMN_117297 [Dreissena polymorpha]